MAVCLMTFYLPDTYLTPEKERAIEARNLAQNKNFMSQGEYNQQILSSQVQHLTLYTITIIKITIIIHEI